MCVRMQFDKRPDKKPDKKDKRPERPRRLDDYCNEIVGRLCVVHLSNGSVIECRVVDNSRYWIKLITKDERVVYLNKAFIVYFEPL